ncbi:MAG: hypothetical protein KR126chlam3_01160 [Chlamydiae bacterium]|nr:hypothetical protein [Chlamydiota bacterium]
MNIGSVDKFITQTLPGAALDLGALLVKKLPLPDGDVVAKETIQWVLDTTANHGRKDLKDVTHIQQTSSYLYGLEYGRTAYILAIRHLHLFVSGKTKQTTFDDTSAQKIRKAAETALIEAKGKKGENRSIDLDTIKSDASHILKAKMASTEQKDITTKEMVGYLVRKGSEGTLAWAVRWAVPSALLYLTVGNPFGKLGFTAISVACVYAWSGQLVPRARKELKKTSARVKQEIKLTSKEQKALVSRAKDLFSISNVDDPRLQNFRKALEVLDLSTPVKTPFTHVRIARATDDKVAPETTARKKKPTKPKGKESGALEEKSASKETPTEDLILANREKAILARNKHGKGSFEWHKANIQVCEFELAYYQTDKTPGVEIQVRMVEVLGKDILSKIAVIREEKPRSVADYIAKTIKELEVRVTKGGETAVIQELLDVMSKIRAEQDKKVKAPTKAPSVRLLSDDPKVKPLGKAPPPATDEGIRHRKKKVVKEDDSPPPKVEKKGKKKEVPAAVEMEEASGSEEEVESDVEISSDGEGGTDSGSDDESDSESE